MPFIILHWRGSFVLKLKKVNQGIDEHFPRSSKLILWLSAPGSCILILIANGQSAGHFTRISLVYTGWFSIRQLIRGMHRLFWPSQRLATGKQRCYRSRRMSCTSKGRGTQRVEFYTVQALCIYRAFFIPTSQNEFKHTSQLLGGYFLAKDIRMLNH